MTAPAVPDNPTNAVTLDEMERELTPPAPKPEDIKFEGDTIPEAIRGKTAAQIAEETDRLRNALRISEAERLRALETQPAAVSPTPVAPVDDYKPLSAEQIQALYEENPLKAIEAMNNDAMIRADRHFENRFRQLEGSLSGTQEAWARSEFKDEFQVLGKEIESLVAQIPNKAVLSDKKSWQDLISYVRGQPGNFEKLWNHRAGKPDITPAAAREEQVANAGFSPRPTSRSESPAATPTTLDATSRRVAEVLGMSESDYIKWSKVGGNS